MPKLQLKLVAGLAALVAITVLTSGYLAHRGLREQAMAQLERSLVQRAELVRELVAGIPLDPARSRVLSERARRAAGAAQARVTLMAGDGTVVADSDVRFEDLVRVENHAGRPEIRAALGGETGSSRRRSETVGRPLFYLALPADAGGEGVVRLAVELPDIEASVAALRSKLLVAGGVGMIAALLLSFVLSRITLRPLSEMRDVVASIADGHLERRLFWHARDERGEIATAINRVADQLSARVQELMGEKEQLRSVLSGMVEGVLVVGSDGRVVLANPALREMLSVWGSVEGQLPLEVIRNASIEEALEEAARSGGPVLRELESGGAEERTLQMHAVSFKVDDTSAGVVAVFHDLTEIRQLERMRSDFVANASHELKTPVTAIRGFAETLVSREVPAGEQESHLKIILQNAERLSQLIEDLLELSRIESHRTPPRSMQVDVRRLARELLADLRPMFEQRSIRARLVEGDAAVAWADRAAVEEVLRNLLDNAAKYTDVGGAVEVGVSLERDQIKVEVADTGVGIPHEDQARIFERFYRVDKARSRALGGTGLGLAIAKHLVHAMGGEIFVESQLGRGSTFAFTLPIESPEESTSSG